VAYDVALAERIRRLLDGIKPPGLAEKRMFGGVCYLVRGNMACGVYKNKLIVRVGLQKYQDALAGPYTSVFDITGRPMKGWVMVEREGLGTDDALTDWVRLGVDFALSLPPKQR
jgi:TfoX/Sxy family transcriptional regulator of competence genes